SSVVIRYLFKHPYFFPLVKSWKQTTSQSHGRNKRPAPHLVLSFQPSEENLLPGLKIIVDGSSGERGFLSDIPYGDISEAHCFIKRRAGVDDLFFSRVCQFF